MNSINNNCNNLENNNHNHNNHNNHNNYNDEKNNNDHDHGHGHSLSETIACHLPFGIYSVAGSFVLASLMSYFSFGATAATVSHGAHIMFHSFHFLHVVFAASGATLTYFSFLNKDISNFFSKDVWEGLMLCAVTALIFCVMSDMIIPYISGRALGVTMEFHICFFSEIQNVLPFLIAGVFNGWLMSNYHKSSYAIQSASSHAMHVFVSSLASTMYLVSHGFHDWYKHMGITFLLLLLAVVVPCTLSDIVIPLFLARNGKNK